SALGRAMSAFAPKQTCDVALQMSAFGGKADIPILLLTQSRHYPWNIRVQGMLFGSFSLEQGSNAIDLRMTPKNRESENVSENAFSSGERVVCRDTNDLRTGASASSTSLRHDQGRGYG